MWVDLIQAGEDGRKLNGKSNRILLWQQLKPEKQFQPLRPKRQRSETEPRVLLECLQDCLLESEPAGSNLHSSPPRKMIGKHGLTAGKVKVTALRGLDAAC